MSADASGSVPAVGSQGAATSATREIRWIRTTWTDPRGELLRAAMGQELGPRYAGLRRGTPPPPPTSEDVVLVLIAEVDGVPVATGSLRRLGALWEVKRLFVDANARRLGLAAGILSRLEDEVRRRGGTEIHLQTGRRQPEAIALYEREGWHRVPVFPPYSPTDGISVCFAKPLGAEHPLR